MIRFLHQTRRRFCFAIDKDLDFEQDGIKAKDGLIWFPRKCIENTDKVTFNDIIDCEKWIGNYYKGNSNMDKKQTKQLHETQTKALEITDKDWSLMSKWITGKRSQEDFRIFEDWLAHNSLDRDNERFPLAVLQRFDKTIVGKQKLTAHQWGGHGIGRYYKSRLEKMTVEEAIETLNLQVPSEIFRKRMDYVTNKDGGFYVLVSTFYVPKHKSEIILDIESGITNSSIGFMGLQKEEIKSDDGEFSYTEYKLQDHAEALEGSIVGVESQYGMRIKKDFNESDTFEQGNKAEWSTAYINTLEDNCFAVVEPTGEKDNEGRTIPRNARHLPHHAKGDGSSGTGGTVDPVHLRNALARMNQIKPATDKISTEALRTKARNHLVAHAKKEGIGDWDLYDPDAIKLTHDMAIKPLANEHECTIKSSGQYERFARVNCDQKYDGKCIDIRYGIKEGKSEIQALIYKKDVWTETDAKAHCKNRGGVFLPAKAEAPQDDKIGGKPMKFDFQIESLGVKIPIDSESFEENLLEAQKVLADKITKTVTEITEQFEPIESELKELKSVLGVNTADKAKELVRKAKDGEVLKEDLINETVKYGILAQLIENDETKVNERKRLLLAHSVEEIKERFREYEKIVNEKYRNNGLLKENIQGLSLDRTLDLSPPNAFKMD